MKDFNKGQEPKRKIILFIVSLSLLLYGCAGNEINDEEATENTVSTEDMAETYINTEEGTTATNNSKTYSINIEKIINFQEVFFELEIPNPPNDFTRDIIIEDYSNDFPRELQEILIQLNDDIETGDQDWQYYEADYESITRDTAGDLPFEDIVATEETQMLSVGRLKVVDIDSDGENEYVITCNDNGTGHYLKTFVIKNIDGNWTCIGGHGNGDRNAHHEILEYENRYYLLMGDQLAYWNDEAEMPDWEKVVVPGQTECWNTLSIEREVTGYTPHELYSNSQDVAMDVLSQVDLTDLDQNAESGEYSLRSIWNTEHNIFLARYVWTVYDGTEKYEYAISEFSDFYPFQDDNKDLVLTVTRKTEGGMQEIVKVYYLAANFKMYFVRRPE